MEIGEKIGKYLIVEVLLGGMSEVYRVVDGNDRYVLKIIKDEANDADLKLFRREIRILKQLHHPNIIQIIEDTYESEKPYYIMPNCGKSFVDVACRDVEEMEKVDYSIDFCKAIAYAHTEGVFHRDIKPQNVLILNGQVKVSDFGLSRFENRDTTTITSSSLAAGTRGYMPPEFQNGGFKEGTVGADIYMIGKTLYYVFSSAKDVSNIRQEFVSPHIFNIVDLCTKYYPEDRIASVGGIVDLLVDYKKHLEAKKNAPKSIKYIKEHYKPGSSEFNDEIYKALMAFDSNPVTWGDFLGKLSFKEMKSMLEYKRHLIGVLANHFMACILEPSEYVQFPHVDEYAKFSKAIILVCTDNAVKQNVLFFLVKLSLIYNRYPAMEIVGEICNAFSDEAISDWSLFIKLHQKEFAQIIKSLGHSPFDNRISALLN